MLKFKGAAVLKAPATARDFCETAASVKAEGRTPARTLLSASNGPCWGPPGVSTRLAASLVPVPVLMLVEMNMVSTKLALRAPQALGAVTQGVGHKVPELSSAGKPSHGEILLRPGHGDQL